MNKVGKPESNQQLYAEVRELIELSKQQIASNVNSSMTLLYWEVGRRVLTELARFQQESIYGKQVVANLSEALVHDYGSSFAEKNLRRMIQFAKVFPDREKVVPLIRQLSWTHLLAIIPIDDPLKRSFYAQLCIHENWSVRVFRERIKSMLYERTAISRKPEETIQNDLNLLDQEKKLNPDLVFRDPYLLDFLGLKDSYSERDLENSILVELQKFIIELGSDFAFLARQKRITIDDRDYYIDLLFYHRRLKSLVAIDLKIGEFEAAYKGQMELYLSYLKKYESVEGENSPIGLILCAGKNSEHIELMQLEKSNIKVAEYLTLLPPQKVLQEQLHRAIEIAQAKINADQDE